MRHVLLLTALLAASLAAAGAINAAPLDAVLLANNFPYRSFGFILGDATGILYSRAVGGFDLARGVSVASASKWVTQWLLSLLLEDGTLRANMTARSVLAAPWGALPLGDPRGDITLESLMSFTSGLNDSVVCAPGSTPAACAAELLAGQAPLPLPPTPACPASFFYAGSHQLLAGYMAVAASRAVGWNALFAARLARPWGLSAATFYTPLVNPQPGGGLYISALDYATLLRAYFAGALLSPSSVAAVEADRTREPGTCVVYAPLSDFYAWHYGRGHWLECRAPGAVGGASRAWQPACDAACAHSSIGLFGTYPFIDRCRGYWALLMVENGTAGVSALVGETLWPAAVAALGARSGSLAATAGATGTATRSRSGSASGSSSATRSSLPSTSGTGSSSATGSGAGTGSSSATGSGAGTGSSSSTGSGTGSGTGTGSPSSAGTTSSSATGMGSGSGTGSSTGSGSSSATGTGSMTGPPSSSPMASASQTGSRASSPTASLTGAPSSAASSSTASRTGAPSGSRTKTRLVVGPPSVSASRSPSRTRSRTATRSRSQTRTRSVSQTRKRKQ